VLNDEFGAGVGSADCQMPSKSKSIESPQKRYPELFERTSEPHLTAKAGETGDVVTGSSQNPF
jgi:hypothetical protein